MSVALFAEPIRVWADGKRFIWLGITKAADTDEEWAILNDETGHLVMKPLGSVVTEWHWDAKANEWADVSEPRNVE